MMTSLYPKTHGVRENQIVLEPQYLTMTEVLKNAGYRTAAFLANYYYSSNRGFDVKLGDEVGDLDTSMTRQAVEWLDRLDPKRDRFFLWLHQKNPHVPYTPPKKFLELFESGYTGPYNGDGEMTDKVFFDRIKLEERDLAHLMALYDAEVRSSDTNLQHVLAKLKEKGLEENTLVVFIADHGEELYSHQQYFYHQCSIYDSVLRIPLVLKLPGVLDAGKVIDHQVQNLDLAPTLLQLLKLPIPDVFEGRSFLPLLFGESEDEARPAFAERTEGIYSIRLPDWKYIYNPSNLTPECMQRRTKTTPRPYVILSEELYRVREDPGETRNVVAEHPETARQLRARLVEWVETNKRFHKKQQLSKEAEERLRALGYVN
jgi:arylsulfatase A-like enzyme